MLIEWKDILGWEEFYQVSSNGLVRSKDRQVGKRFYKGKILTPFVDIDGYHKYTLCRRPIVKQQFAHILVCEVFNGEKPFAKAQVRHLDGNNSNNYFKNLKWGTSQENYLDRLTHGTDSIGEKAYQAKLNASIITKIQIAINNKKMTRKEIMEKYNISNTTYYRVIHNRHNMTSDGLGVR